jgi:hypothetical protein
MTGKIFSKASHLINDFFCSKKSLFLFFFLLLIVFLIPKQTNAIAQVLLAPVISAVTTTVLTIIWGATSLLTVAIGGLFDIVVNLNVSYTNEQFIYVGWKIIKDITNLFFVIALVIIGLCTALGLADYHAKKTLPTLIFVAILINFSLVIAGFVLDAASIIMNYFLSETVGFTTLLANELQMVFPQGWAQAIISAFTWETPIKLAIAIGINGLIALTFFLYTVLFLVRYAIIWFLVIVSPFAFFCFILPATRQLFFKWWDAFLQWAIIGIPAAFCLYLSMQLMSGLTAANVPVYADNPLSGWFANLGKIIPMIMVGVFALIGLFITISSQFQSAIGQGFITNAVKVGGVFAGKKAGAWLARSKIGASAVNTATQWTNRAQTLLTPAPLQPGAGRLAQLGYHAQRVVFGTGIPGTPLAPLTGILATAESSLRGFQIKEKEMTQRAGEDLLEEWGSNPDAMMAYIRSTKGIGSSYLFDLSAVLSGAAQVKGGLQKFQQEEPDLYYKAVNNIINIPAHHALMEDIVRHNPSMLADDKIKNDISVKVLVKKGTEDTDVKKYMGEGLSAEAAINKVAQMNIIKKLDNSDVPFLMKDSGFLDDKEILRTLAETKGSVEILKEINKKLPSQLTKVQDALMEKVMESGKVNEDLLKKYIQENPAIFTLAYSPTGKNMMNDWQAYDPQDTKLSEASMRKYIKEGMQKRPNP